MRRRIAASDRPNRHSSEPLSGACDHCDWHTVQDSYPAIVEAYQDHLRNEHHEVWVRT